MAAGNMYRIEINIYEKLCVKLLIYKDHTRMYGQQNVKLEVGFKHAGTSSRKFKDMNVLSRADYWNPRNYLIKECSVI